MCGITGIYAFNMIGGVNMINLAKATETLSSRGPDNQAHFHDETIGLGHRRLSIIDPSIDANQPMSDSTGRYTLIYNGEIYNFKSLRKDLEVSGVSFRTNSDTEVLLYLLIHEGTNALKKLNGFFAFAFYDKAENELIIARDRYGIKPLHYYEDQDKFLFASEVKSLLAYGLDKELDSTSLYTYLQLNYLPAPMSMFKGVKKLNPGHLIRIGKGKIEVEKYYEVEIKQAPLSGNFEGSVDRLKDLMEAAVVDRLVSDVPLGTFLSGGVDSTVVSALAARHVDKLNTYSIGFRDEPYFDETDFANAAAKKLNTNHTVFKLTNNDLYENLYSMLDYLDEPFADSSALAVYILSKETRKHVSVALSGDGADELFAGYNKHAALYKMLNGSFGGSMVKGLGSLWKLMPKSRNSSLSNRFRQLEKYSKAAKLNSAERYWLLASIGDADYASSMIKNHYRISEEQFLNLKSAYLKPLEGSASISSNLLVDLNLVLPNDMLTKVDLMSMAQSLEVRVPFLDQRVVEFAFSLPDDMKINSSIRKRVVQEAFKELMPKMAYNRKKKGFEVPLLKWFRTEMKSTIQNDLLDDDFIIAQGIFDVSGTRKLKKQLFSGNPGDAHAKIWALIVFQWWRKRYFSV